MNATTINLSDGQLRELRALGVENVSELMRSLVSQYIRRLRTGKDEYKRKREASLLALEACRRDWFLLCLEKARVAGDKKAIAYYEGVLA